jgi:hypothetical protein
MPRAHFTKLILIVGLLMPSLRAEAKGTLERFLTQSGRSLSLHIDGDVNCVAQAVDSVSQTQVDSNEPGPGTQCNQALMGLVRVSRVLSNLYPQPSGLLEFFGASENSSVVALTGLTESQVTHIENYLRQQPKGTYLTVLSQDSGVVVEQSIASPGKITVVRTQAGTGFQSLYPFCQSDRDLMEEFLVQLRDLKGAYWNDKQITPSVLQVQFFRNTESALGALPPQGSLLEKTLRSIMIEAGVEFNHLP